MARKTRFSGKSVLIVTQNKENILEKRKSCRGCRNGKTAHCKLCYSRNGLYRNGLSACVGTAYDHDLLFIRKDKIVLDQIVAAAQINRREPRLFKFHRIFGKFRYRAAVFLHPEVFREDVFDVSCPFYALFDIAVIPEKKPSELAEYPDYLFKFARR